MNNLWMPTVSGDTNSSTSLLRLSSLGPGSLHGGLGLLKQREKLFESFIYLKKFF